MPRILNDLDINRFVRRTLVKYWIDLGRLSVRSVRGHVTLYGRLQRLAGSVGVLAGPAVEAMFRELHRIPGVGRIDAHFENWTNDGGLWRPLDEFGRLVEEGPQQGPPPPLPAPPGEG
jgi:hypothetical protein